MFLFYDADDDQNAELTSWINKSKRENELTSVQLHKHSVQTAYKHKCILEEMLSYKTSQRHFQRHEIIRTWTTCANISSINTNLNVASMKLTLNWHSTRQQHWGLQNHAIMQLFTKFGCLHLIYKYHTILSVFIRIA